MDNSSESNDSTSGQNNRPSLSAPSSSMTTSAHDDRTASNNVHQPLINNPFLPPLLVPPPQITPEAYNYLIHALLALQRSAGHQHPLPLGQQHTQGLSPTYEWPPSNNTPSVTSMAGQPPGYSQVYHHNAMPSFQNSPPQPIEASSSFATTSQSVVAPTHVVETEQTDEAISTAEDKRRRNTAASARFRVKKKMRTLNLERTVADLTGRTEELEREAADLRRENGWLKEIILLKSRSIGGLGPTESQPVGSASIRESQQGNVDGSPSIERRSSQKGKGKDSG
ncbi:hypothetical protein F5J12DRAFT_835269 [Pisolithus orientalis]|uniref:uncharacterized protein n=1 Tax=Pisolithus orientalis TaxID=936130 RepID=UPI0022247E8D|nr:uncharacterized protein F5J12DRAFT_835269 [Pisolithus orientalis]KAI6005168.1 hypothetical protein F5J12DRAFT_835269 [Pisolithus orientalis]